MSGFVRVLGFLGVLMLAPVVHAKECRTGVPCGGSCISADKVCHQPSRGNGHSALPTPRSASATIPASLPQPAIPGAPRTFAEAKRKAEAIYAGHQEDLYCGCHYSDLHHIDLAGCGYVPRKQPQRASRIEWEHIVPAWVFGHQLQCWQQGGRKQCESTSPQFNQMEGDLLNLYPAVGEVNADRNNFGYGMLPGARPMYGQCQTVVDFQQRTAMPREEVRGLVARTWLYMAARYGLRLSRQDQQLYQAWDRSYPPTEWERTRKQRIEAIQGVWHPAH